MNETRPPSLANSKYADPLVAESMRKLDQFMRATVQWFRLPPIDTLYTEPLRLAFPAQPLGIVCVRVRSFPNFSAALVAGGIVPFEWDGEQSNAIVGKVPGLTVGTGTKYRFDFVAVL